MDIRLYVDNTSLDVDSESIVVKRELKDLSEPDKLLTDVSRDLSLPASKTNNKILKHYYNVDIIDGIDGRTLIPCRLEVGNGFTRYGNLFIESVDMVNNAVDTYNVRFMGKMTELKKRFGEDKIADLRVDNVPSWSNYYGVFDGGTTSDDFIVPLSSRTNRYLYDTTQYDIGVENAINIAWRNSSMVDGYAIREDDVVPAVKVGRVLTEIENQYGFTFNGAIKQDYVTDLYMYLNRVQNTQEDSFRVAVGSKSTGAITNTSAVANNLSVFIPNNDKTYKVRFKSNILDGDTATLKFDGYDLSKTQTANTFTDWKDVESGYLTLEMTVKKLTNTRLMTIEIEEFDNGVSNGVDSLTYNAVPDSKKPFFQVYAPTVKVVDFISEIMKLFNLVMTVDEQLNVDTYHYDSFLALGNTVDITKYVEVDSMQIERPNSFSSVSYEFASNKAVINQMYRKAHGRDYGNLKYRLRNNDFEFLAGESYEQKMKSSLMPVDRISNFQSKALTDIGYTLFGSIKGEEQEIGLVFSYMTSGNTDIAYVHNGTSRQVTSYLKPTNSYQHTVGLHFNNEFYEYDLSYVHDGINLWSLFYRGLTTQMFYENKRNVKVMAQLPPHVSENISLADTLLIGNRYYQIESIETRYTDGVSELKLILMDRVKLDEILTNTTTITNGSNQGALEIVYIDSDGYVAFDTINASGSKTYTNHIGVIRNFSHTNYTLS